MILEVENISKSYGKLKVLDGVSFNISEGEYVALIGKNGACLLYTSDAADE